MTSIRSWSTPDAVTSSAVTMPPAASTTLVSWLTAVPPAGTTSRTVIEYETDGVETMSTSWQTTIGGSSPRAGQLRGSGLC